MKIIIIKVGATTRTSTKTMFEHKNYVLHLLGQKQWISQILEGIILLIPSANKLELTWFVLLNTAKLLS